MDEWTLNDLLECSVCLERLDTSSKVLPCQHTFCKKCLEEIVYTHKELRCPECRVLVEIGIDELPPNVLLMRILEGMRNAPRRSSSVVHAFQSETVAVADSSKCNNSTFTSHLRVRSRSANSQGLQVADAQQPYGVAIYDYTAKEPGDLSFKRGDVILLRRKIDNVWYQGECNGVLGVFPLPYVQVMVQLPLPIPYPSHIPQCKALYDFNKCPEDDGCLYFSKGEIITVIRRIDENWAEGKLDDRIGMFPISFVEMNNHAKNLMKATLNSSAMSREPPPTPTEESVPLISSETTGLCNSTVNNSSEGIGSTLSPSSSSSSSTSTATTSPSSSESTTPSSPVTSPSANNSAQSSNKRHSFTLGAQPPPYQAPPAVHRHSAEILKTEENLSLSNSSYDQLRQHAKQSAQKLVKLTLQKSHQSHLEDTPTRQSYQRKKQLNQGEQETNCEPQSLCLPAKQTNDNVIENFQRQGSLRISKNSSSHSKPHSSPPLPDMYIAIYPYKPQKTDELELKIGSVYTVIERCQDGWYKGTSQPNQRCGVFPGNYVTPVKFLPMLHAQLRGIMHSSGSPRHDARSTSEVRTSPPQSKSSSSALSSPVVQNNGNVSRLAPPELPARSVSPLLLSSTSQKNSSTVWHVSCSETVQEKSITSSVSATKNRTRTEMSENGETLISSTNSGQKSNGIKTPKPTERNKEKKEKASVSLMRRLTSMKKSRSPPPTSSYSIDNPVFEDSGSVFVPVTHVRSDSCPSQLSYNTPTHATSSTNNHTNVVGGSQRVKHKQRSSLQNQFTRTFESGSSSPSNSKLTKEDKPVVSHRKSSSLDTTAYDERHKTKPSVPPSRERYRCIAPYPPNSEFELELKVNDIIYVHKKREDGWYKGTLQRNGRTGLFPASFVEST